MNAELDLRNARLHVLHRLGNKLDSIRHASVDRGRRSIDSNHQRSIDDQLSFFRSEKKTAAKKLCRLRFDKVAAQIIELGHAKRKV